MNRAFAWVLAGTAGALGTGLPGLFSGTGPMAGTLGILPLVVGIFGAANALVPAKAPDRFLTARLLTGSALVLLALARGQLGLRYGEALGSAVIIGGLFVLLLWQAAAGIRLLAHHSPRNRDGYLAFFLIVFAVYLGVQRWQSEQRPPDGDEPYYLLLTHSLAYDLDSDLTNNYEQGDSLEFMARRIDPQLGDPVGANGERYSRHNMALPLLLAPAYRLMGAYGALIMMAAITAALALLILRLGDHYFPERPAACLWTASVAALSPPLLLYSYQVWVEVPAALLVATATSGILTMGSESPSWRRSSFVIVPILLLPLLKLRFLALSVSLLALALLRTSRPTRKILLRGGVVLLSLTALTLLFNQTVFGQALKHHSWHSLTTYFVPLQDYLRAPYGLLFDHTFGLFLNSPIWLVLIPGAWLVMRTRRQLLWDTAILCAPYLLLVGPRWYWYGGWSPPFRYGIAFLPLLTLAAVPILARRRQAGVQYLLGALLAVTLALSLLWLVVPGWTYNFADGRSYLVDYLTTSFEADVARLFPSAIRPRAANLVWLAALLALVPGIVFGFRRKSLSANSTAGVAAILLALAALPLLAERLPLRVVEFEDPYVEKHGGELWPDQWVPNRADFVGSWRLRPGEEVTVPIVPSGIELVLTLRAKRIGPLKSAASLELLADDRPVASISLPPSPHWSTLNLEPLPWPSESRKLSLRLEGARRTQILIDWARLEWK